MSADVPPLPGLHLLGQPRLAWPDGRVHVLERRDAALLAALVLQGPMPRERAIAWLWPQAERKAGQNNLRQRLFRLRQQAGCDLVSSAAVLAWTGVAQADTDTFAQRLLADAAADDELLATLDYRDTGDLAEWVEAAREQWRQRRRVLLSQAADEQESAGRSPQALALAERLLRDDPGAERAHRQRMRLHYLRGDHAAAALAWRQCQQALRDWVEAEPGPETRALATLIQQGLPLAPAAPAAVAEPTPPALQRPPRLIGREAAWRSLQQAWQQGRHLVLSGEPGMGKSRLLTDFAQAQAQAHAPTQGQAHWPLHSSRPGDTTVPYTTLARLLRQLRTLADVDDATARSGLAWLLPELGPAEPGPLQPLRLRRALAQALSAWRTLGLPVLMVDDWQFADAASTELLLALLAEGDTGLPLLWVAVRSNEQAPALTAWAHDLPAGSVTELQLQALQPADVQALVASLGLPALDAAAEAPALAARSGGNPLFVLQLLLALRAGQGAAVPRDIGRLIDHRLQQLGPAALRLARVAALAGPDHGIALAAQVLGCRAIDLADAVAELERAQIFRDGGFAYDLLAEGALRSVPEAVARELHAALALALQQQGGAPLRVAEHWRRAQRWAEAAEQFETASLQAQVASRQAEELQCLESAAACHHRAGNPSRAFTALCGTIKPAFTVESHQQVRLRAQGLLEAAVGEEQRFEGLLLAANVAMVTHDADGLARAREAHAMAQVWDSMDVRRVKATSLYGTSLVLGGRMEDGIALLESASDGAAGADPTTRRAHFGYLGYAFNAVGRLADAARVQVLAVAAAEESGDLHEAMVQLGNLASIRAHMGDAQGALDGCERALRAWRRLGEPPGLIAAITHMNLGLHCATVGHLGRAVQVLEAALEDLRRSSAGVWVLTAEHHLSHLFLQLGQPARARQLLTPLPPDVVATVRLKRLALLSLLDDRAGQRSFTALQEAVAAMPPDVRMGDRFGLQLALAALLPPEQALALATQVRQAALAVHASAALHALARQADAWHRLGRHEAAAQAAREAVRGLQQGVALQMPAPELLWFAVQALDAAGAKTEAQQALQQALAWLSRAEADLPAAFKESFRVRNPVHRALLQRAGNRASEAASPAADLQPR